MKDNLNKHEIGGIEVSRVDSGNIRLKINKKLFLFQGKINEHGKRVEIIMPLRCIEAFEMYLDSLGEYYDEESIIVSEADIFAGTVKKTFKKVKRSDYGKKSKKIHRRDIRYLGTICYIAGERVNCFFSCILFSGLRDKN